MIRDTDNGSELVPAATKESIFNVGIVTAALGALFDAV
jgi:hypothetical protein